jgi:hypothetical protein
LNTLIVLSRSIVGALALATFIITAASNPAPATTAPAIKLPSGVKRIVFGTAYRTKEPTRGDTCTIKDTLPSPPVFKADTTEITYIVEMDCGVGKVEASVLGDIGAKDIAGLNCNAYGLSGGRICQTQLGSTVSRLDKKPFKAGLYKLKVTAGRDSVEIPFHVK